MVLVCFPSLRATRYSARASRARGTGACARRRRQPMGAPRAAARSPRRRPPTMSCCACTRRRIVERMAATAGQAVMLDADTFTSPDSYDIALLAAGATVQAAEHAVTEREAASRSCVRRGTTPNRIERWASASSTTLPSPRRRCSPAVSSASRSSTSTCTTATARRRCSTTIRACLYVSTHQFPFYPGTGAADEIGAGDGPRIHRQRADGSRCRR